ncbi:MAG: DNA-binding response regulator [Chloroflexi bacterium HGW-Chloroflexi-9]|nr:MAG: DNA-binding response regulator [Chloroflexi bacterium HGW-Chloroflexi-9]
MAADLRISVGDWMRLLDADGTGEGARILVVDDDERLRAAVLPVLAECGWHVRGVTSGERAIELLAQDSIALVILDAALPGISGFETLRQIRARSAVPVLMLSAAGSVDERVAGFDLGADDYVTKPVELAELQRRVRALLRRIPPDPESYEALTGPAGLELHPHLQEVTVDGQPIRPTPREFDILWLLLERRGSAVTPDEISRRVWDYETLGSRNFVEAHISRLRAKLRAAGAHDVITTVRGVGYRIR